MRFILLSILFCLSLVLSGYAEKKFKLTSFSRIFFDDNVFMRAAGTPDQTSTFYFSQSLGIDGKFFRDLITLKAQPEIRHRTVDSKTLVFGNIGIKSKYEITPKLILDSANTFSHSEREPSDIDDDIDVTYFMNKSSYELAWQPRYLLKLKGGYENYVKRWSDNLPVGSGTELTNGDFTKNTYSFTAEQILGKRFILELVGKKSFLEYNGVRGAIDTDMYYAQFSYVMNPSTIIKINYGGIDALVKDQAGNLTEYSTPTYGANITYFTERGTVIGLNTVYEVMDSSVAYWNMKENLKTALIVKYPITPKLEVSAMGAHLITNYKDIGNRYQGLGLEREEEVFVSSVTLAWKYNQFHYAEVGYQGLHLFNKDADVYKNKVFFGYRWVF
ncbi:MAG: hypothetical protein CMK36_05605 [Porticoccaceae bacterium]|nr:hypothetical protein [Porticoccaceae bacterium]